MTLSEYLGTHPFVGPFQAVPRYDAGCDAIEHWSADVRYYSEQVDGYLTIYREEGTGRIIGAKIHGVSLALHIDRLPR